MVAPFAYVLTIGFGLGLVILSGWDHSWVTLAFQTFCFATPYLNSDLLFNLK